MQTDSTPRETRTSTKGSVPSLWGAAWAGDCGESATWQDAATMAGDVISNHLKLGERILASAREAGGFPEDIQNNGVTMALDLGVILGYALAQTFPGSIQDLGDWPARALEKADLEAWPWFSELPTAENNGRQLRAVDSEEGETA